MTPRSSRLGAVAGTDFLAQRHPTRLGMAILISGAMFLVAVGGCRLLLQRQIERATALENQAQERARRQAIQPVKVDVAAVRARASLLDELRSPWDVPLRAIEQVPDTGTTLLAAEPDFRSKALRLDVSASALSEVWAFADALRASGMRAVDVERVVVPKNGGTTWEARVVARWDSPTDSPSPISQGGAR